MVDEPDGTSYIKAEVCSTCGEVLIYSGDEYYQRRQVIDLVDKQQFVTEYRLVIKKCACGTVNKGDFPTEVQAPVQYGPAVIGTAVYLNKRQLIPYGRTSEAIFDIFGIKISPGTIVKMTKQTSHKLIETVEEIKEAITESPVVNFDESGMQVEGSRHWVHVAVTSVASFFSCHVKRGSIAMDDIGILPVFIGGAIHDHLKAYFTYIKSSHYLCNAHHLRELEFIKDRYKHPWAKEMQELLRKIYKYVEKRKSKGYECVPKKKIKQFEEKYRALIQKGYIEDPKIIKIEEVKKRGPKAQSKGRNLLDRLRKFESSVLGFMHDFNIPFDNNQAERDVRMLKVHQKISGSFRSQQGPVDYCRIMSYISTIRKNSINVIDAISSIFEGKPILPVLVSP